MLGARAMLVNESRARELMTDHGIDAMVAATPENVAYLSDYAPWTTWFYRGTTTKKGGREAYAVLPRDQGTSPALMTGRLGMYQSQWPSWISDLYTWESTPFPDDEALDPDVENQPEVQRLQGFTERATKTDTAQEALVAALKDRGLERGVVALDLEGVPPSTLKRLRAECPDATLLDGGAFFRFVRAVKSSEEIERLRTSASINERAITRVIAEMEVGVTEKELARIHRQTVTELGADPAFFNIYAGKRSGVFWEPSERPIQPGDLVWFDGGCTYERYHSDTGTCAVVGDEPTDQMKRWYEFVESGMEGALNAVSAGVSCSEVTASIRETMERAGTPVNFEGWSGNTAHPEGAPGYGHGIGIEPRDLPLIDPPYGDFDDPILEGSSDITLETDMVLNFEIPFRRWNLGAMQKEYTIVVKQDGYEHITNQPRTLHVI